MWARTDECSGTKVAGGCGHIVQIRRCWGLRMLSVLGRNGGMGGKRTGKGGKGRRLDRLGF